MGNGATRVYIHLGKRIPALYLVAYLPVGEDFEGGDEKGSAPRPTRWSTKHTENLRCYGENGINFLGLNLPLCHSVYLLANLYLEKAKVYISVSMWGAYIPSAISSYRKIRQQSRQLLNEDCFIFKVGTSVSVVWHGAGASRRYISDDEYDSTLA